MKPFVAAPGGTIFVASTANTRDTAAFAGAQVYFVNLADGDRVASPFRVVFGLSGMRVAPVGVEKENSGHHHLLLNRPPLGEGDRGAAELKSALPVDDNHIHFGSAQTQVTLELPSGTHTLQLVMADLNHVPHATPVISQVLTITVT